MMATSAPRSIVCGINYNPASDRALKAALYLSHVGRGNLALVHAVDRVGRRAEATARLRRLADERAPGAPLDLLVEVGEPAHLLVKAARDRDADLLVIGRSQASDALVTVDLEEAVLASAPCPVLQVGATEDPLAAARPHLPITIAEIRCTVCAQPRGATICESCRLRIASEHLRHKLDQEHLPGRGLHLEDRMPSRNEPGTRRS
jgi:nucleotide-binding universal stress UspA family protein